MKKIIYAVITAILLVSVLFVSVAAAGVVATTDSKSCAQGGTVTLSVNISSASSVKSGAVEVLYDKNILELVSAEWHTDGALLSTYDMSTDLGAFAYQADKNLSGKIFSVTFKVLGNAPVGKTNVECRIQLRTGSNDITVTNQAGSINVTCNHTFTEKNDQYLASEASCTSPITYFYACSICGEKGTTTYTVGSALPHTYDKKVTTTAYLVKNVTCVNEAEYYYSCLCGAKGTEKFTSDASWSHNFSENWFISADGHWHQCIACGAKKDNASHSPNANNVCSKCQFVISNDGAHYHSFGDAWVSSNDAHWHECSCGLKDNLELHNWNEGKETKPATDEEDGEMLYTCTDCGKTKIESIDKLSGATHSHTFGDAWANSDDAHWHECSCGLKDNLELHNWNEGKETKPATESEEGEKLFTCVDCGATKTEKIAKFDASKPGEGAGDNTSSSSIGTVEIILIAGAGMLALLVVEAAAFVIYKFIIKKKQHGITENNNNSESDSDKQETDALDDPADSSQN